MNRVLNAATGAGGGVSPAHRHSLPSASSIKAVVRVRPFSETETGRQLPFSILGGNTVVAKNQAYVFDRVFPMTTSQQELYDSAVKPLVASTLDGCNVSVMAYGQSGTGKTHTMGFGTQRVQEKGIVELFFADLFESLQAEPTRKFKVLVSHMDVDGKTLIDLANPKGKKLEIKHNQNGTVKFPGLTKVEIKSAGEAVQRLRSGCRRRRTAATTRNKRSSRTHSIFSAQLQPLTSESMNAEVSFVDLAGSEKGEDDSVAINVGLTALRSAIIALKNNQHKGGFTFRNHELPHSLANYLDGNCRTVLIGCVSSSTVRLNETVQTLKYMAEAEKIEIQPTHSIVRGEPLLTRVTRERDALVESVREQHRRDSFNALEIVVEELANDLAHEFITREDIPHHPLAPLLREKLQLFHAHGGTNDQLDALGNGKYILRFF